MRSPPPIERFPAPVASPGDEAVSRGDRPKVRRRRRSLRILPVVAGLLAMVTATSLIYNLYTAGALSDPPLDAHGHQVQTGDVVTRYEQWGHRGTPLVLVPGFLESSFVWRSVGALLGARFRVYAPDVRGFGYTTHRPPYTLAADTAQLTVFLHVLQLDAAHHAVPVLVGHSSGAGIVVNMARLHPDLIQGIVMVDGDGTPGGSNFGWVRHLIVDPFFTSVLRFALRHPAIPQYIWGRTCGPSCPPLSGAELDGWRRPLEVAGAEAALHSIVQAPIIGLDPSQMVSIHIPAALLLGSDDPTITVTEAATVAGWLHTDTILTVKGARHLPMISQPVTFTHDLTWIVEHLGRARRDNRT